MTLEWFNRQAMPMTMTQSLGIALIVAGTIRIIIIFRSSVTTQFQEPFHRHLVQPLARINPQWNKSDDHHDFQTTGLACFR